MKQQVSTMWSLSEVPSNAPNHRRAKRFKAAEFYSHTEKQIQRPVHELNKTCPGSIFIALIKSALHPMVHQNLPFPTFSLLPHSADTSLLWSCSRIASFFCPPQCMFKRIMYVDDSYILLRPCSCISMSVL